MPSDPLKINNIYAQIALAILFASVMISIDWESLQGFGGGFVDKKRYFEYFKYEESVLEYADFNSIVDFLKNEYLWHFTVRFLYEELGIPLEWIFPSISFLVLAVFSLFTTKHAPVYGIILIVNPIIITLVFSQFRSALAMSLLLGSYLTRSKIVSLIAIILVPFFHTSFILFIALYFCVKLIYVFYRKYQLYVLLLPITLSILGVFVSVVTGPLRGLILGSIGDRRADLQDMSSSFAYTLFWAGLYCVCLIQKKGFYLKEINGFAVLILACVSFSVLTGSYTTRIIALFFPLLITAMLSIKAELKTVTIIVYILYTFLLWIYWLRTGWM